MQPESQAEEEEHHRLDKPCAERHRDRPSGHTVVAQDGETLEEAKEMAKDAIKAYLKSMEKHKEKVQDDLDTLESMLTLKYA